MATNLVSTDGEARSFDAGAIAASTSSKAVLHSARYTVSASLVAAALPGFLPGHVYANVVRGLHSPLMAGVYIGAALLLGLHLFHGLWAAMRSLGVWPDGAARRRRPAVAALSAAVALGFASVPLAVPAGWLR